MSETIYILLPVHNRREITRRFVASLKAQTYRHFHLVLIDDGSSDATAEMVRQNIAPLTVITGSGAWWWAGSLQQGYLWLKERQLPGSDLVLIINDDTEFEPDFLEGAAALLRHRDRTMLLAWCYCREDGRLLDSGVHVDWSRLSFQQAAAPEEINCLSTRGLFMRISDFLATGGFRPAVLPHYTSDYEFTIRAGRRGMQLISDAACRLTVDQSTTGCQLVADSPARSLANLFSNRSAWNPLMWTAFIALSCPWRYKLVNLCRVWIGFLANVYRIARVRATDRKIGPGAAGKAGPS